MVAYDVLRDVDDRDAYANLALSARIREARLDSRDAALATELASGALRWRGRYDRIIELAADRDAERIDSRTLNVLRLGAHQLLSMRTADHAAVNESVELQRRVGNRAAAGFVNGVLRAIGRASNTEWDERITAASRSEDDALAATTSHPAWVLRALRDALRAEGRQHELADLLQIGHPELVRLLDNLERKGLVVRHDASDDRRVKRIALTPSGRRIAERAASMAEAFERRTLQGISTQDRARTLEVFARIEERLDSLPPPVKPKLRARTP